MIDKDTNQPNTSNRNVLLVNYLKRKRWLKANSIICSDKHYHLDDKHDRTICNALHIACTSRDTPLYIINNLIESLPSHHALLLCDDLRFHNCKNPTTTTTRGPPHLLRTALKSSSDDVVITLINSCPQAACNEDDEGKTALFLAMTMGRSINVVRTICHAQQEQEQQKRVCYRRCHNHHYGRSSSSTAVECKKVLELFFERWNMGLRHIFATENDDDDDNHRHLRDNNTSHPRVFNDVEVPHRIESSTIGHIYEITKLLLSAAIPGRHYLPQSHSSILLPSCPWSFSHLIFRACPESVWEINHRGDLPLHVALHQSQQQRQSLSSLCDGSLYHCSQCRKTLGDDDEWYQHEEHVFGLYGHYCIDCVGKGLVDSCYFERERYRVVKSFKKIKKTINSIITRHPLSASIPDHNHRLPLHLATENNNHDRVTIEEIFYASPHALQTRDVTTHMLPFMSSSAASSAAANDDDDSRLEQFTSCFALLMEDPTLIKANTMRC